MRRVSPFILFLVFAFIVLVAVPVIGVVVEGLKHDQTREQREAEDRANLRSLAAQRGSR